jgi:hypothetical protein
VRATIISTSPSMIPHSLDDVDTHDVGMIQSLRDCYAHFRVKVQHPHDEIQAEGVSLCSTERVLEAGHGLILTTTCYAASLAQ